MNCKTTALQNANQHAGHSRTANERPGNKTRDTEKAVPVAETTMTNPEQHGTSPDLMSWDTNEILRRLPPLHHIPLIDQKTKIAELTRCHFPPPCIDVAIWGRIRFGAMWLCNHAVVQSQAVHGIEVLNPSLYRHSLLSPILPQPVVKSSPLRVLEQSGYCHISQQAER